MTRDEHRRRWTSTARITAAGTLIGAGGGAVAGTSSLLGQEGFSTSACLVFGGGFGAVFGLFFGLVTGALGGCLAVHIVGEHPRLARTLLTVCSGVLIALATTWSLGPQTAQFGWIILAAALASSAAWLCAPWCLRPLRVVGSSPA